MEDYNEIIESLEICFVKAKNISILRPVTIENNYEVENFLVLVTAGEIKYGKEKEVAGGGDVIFVPGGKSISMTYGGYGKPTHLSKEDFLSSKDQYLKSFTQNATTDEHYSYVAFDAKAFDSVSFFSSLGIPPFKMEGNYKLAKLIQQINDENMSNMPGKDRIVKILTESMTIELIRFILSKGLFVEKLATNSSCFRDPRLMDIFIYIKESLSEDLSNKILANVANVSEDYVGQYFKMLTGTNPQDYIECQRMEAAINLLRTSKKSIRDIGKDVGYKDTAYFCRRFKMMFGIPAGKMRRRESLINV